MIGTRQSRSRFEVVVPAVTNAGGYSGYAEAFRRALLVSGIDAWTETASVGYWRGESEPGTVFLLFMPDVHELPTGERVYAFNLLGDLASAAMPDQEAILVARSPAVVELVEPGGPPVPVCEECGERIPVVPGGGLANRHHAASCSLYDEHVA